MECIFCGSIRAFLAPLYLGTDGGDDGKDVIINVTGKESYDYSQSG